MNYHIFTVTQQSKGTERTMYFNLSFPKKSDLPMGQTHIFRKPCIATKFPPRSLLSDSSVNNYSIRRSFPSKKVKVPTLLLSFLFYVCGYSGKCSSHFPFLQFFSATTESSFCRNSCCFLLVLSF